MEILFVILFLSVLVLVLGNSMLVINALFKERVIKVEHKQKMELSSANLALAEAQARVSNVDLTHLRAQVTELQTRLSQLDSAFTLKNSLIKK